MLSSVLPIVASDTDAPAVDGFWPLTSGPCLKTPIAPPGRRHRWGDRDELRARTAMLPVSRSCIDDAQIRAHDGGRDHGVDGEIEGQLHRLSPLRRHQLPPWMQPT